MSRGSPEPLAIRARVLAEHAEYAEKLPGEERPTACRVNEIADGKPQAASSAQDPRANMGKVPCCLGLKRLERRSSFSR
jgi:hypothetical protein